MAKRKKTGGRDFLPGNTAAKAKALSPESKALRKLTTDSFIKLCNELLFAPRDLIERKLENSDTPMIEIALLNLLKDMANGQMGVLEMFLNRTIGKVPDKIHTTEMSYLEYLKLLAKEEEDG